MNANLRRPVFVACCNEIMSIDSFSIEQVHKERERDCMVLTHKSFVLNLETQCFDQSINLVTTAPDEDPCAFR